jgi:hypothetical protein
MIARALPIVVLLGLAAAVASVHARPEHAAPQPLVMTASTHGFALTGVAVTGLYPGSVKSMKVTVRNPYGFSVKATLSARVSAATTAAGCTGTPANLRVTAPKAAAVVKAHKSKALTLTVTMPGSVANACQGARFAIALRGKASKS